MSDPERHDKMSLLLSQASEIFAEQRRAWKATAPRFNVFNSISFVDYELRHTEFIAFLLDPLATHDQGTDFIEAFLSHIGVTGVEGLSRARVVTEMVIPNRRLDIFIHIPGTLALIIENKIWSLEGADQIGAYQAWLVNNHTECSVKRVVFLSPNRQEPRAPREAPPIAIISYTDIRCWLEPFVLRGGTLGSTLKMYQDICSRLDGSTMKDRQNSAAVSKLLRSGNNFDIAYTIADSLEIEKSRILREYWDTVTAKINAQLNEFTIPIKWEARIAQYRNRCGHWLAIVPTHFKLADTESGWDPPGFAIVVEDIYTKKESAAYFGIRGLSHVTDWPATISAISGPLIKSLKGFNFKTEDGWFLAYKYFKDQPRHAFFDLSNKASMLKLIVESEVHYPTATWLADTLAELFRQSQPILDELNAVAA